MTSDREFVQSIVEDVACATAKKVDQLILHGINHCLGCDDWDRDVLKSRVDIMTFVVDNMQHVRLDGKTFLKIKKTEYSMSGNQVMVNVKHLYVGQAEGLASP